MAISPSKQVRFSTSASTEILLATTNRSYRPLPIIFSLYTKIVSLNETNKFLALSFFLFQDVKILKFQQHINRVLGFAALEKSYLSRMLLNVYENYISREDLQISSFKFFHL